MTSSVTKKLVGDLKAMGIGHGDTVLVHSALRSLGTFPDKALTVTQALMESIGPNGTLLMPALTYTTVTKQHPIFSVGDTPSCVGGLTEYFRKRSGVQRSLHPTHSVCGMGKKADFVLKDHYTDHTPCGANSPFRKLRDLDASILFLGCSLNTNTSMHGVEELSAPPYLYGETLEYTLETTEGNRLKKSYKTHGFNGYEQRYDRVLGLLSKEDYTVGKVGKATAYLLKCRPLWKKANEQLLKAPFSFVERVR